MSTQAQDHHHEADLEATLEFLNSEVLDGGERSDHLRSADDAVALIAGLGLAHEGALRAQARAAGDEAWLGRIRATRGALRHVSVSYTHLTLPTILRV